MNIIIMNCCPAWLAVAIIAIGAIIGAIIGTYMAYRATNTNNN